VGWTGTKRGISRRDFLGLTALGVFGFTGGELVGLGREAIEIRQAWALASRGSDRLLASRARDFERLTLGTSFAPEQWGFDGRRVGQAFAALRFGVEELGMREVRLGFRWNRVERRNGGIDFRYYEPFLDYCFNHDVNVCLNVGPIKTFRWPEEHVPDFVLRGVESYPAKGDLVEADSAIADEAIGYLERMLDSLFAHYGHDALGRVQMVQPDNEPFYALGLLEWRMTSSYMRRVIDAIDAYFPDRPILVSSAGRLNLNEIQQLFFDLKGEGERFRGRMVLGFDYHYRTPLRDSYPVVRHLDPIAFSRFFETTCEENIRVSRSTGYKIEVTEGQAEPYGYLTAPGNSARDFRFMLIRCLDKVLDPREPALLRVWGVEELAKRALRGDMAQDHREIVELIQRVNFGQTRRFSIGTGATGSARSKPNTRE
jgi:hypothetical protein